MLTRLVVDVKDINPEWVAEIQQRYQGAQLEITVREPEEIERMNEEQFWAIIALLDWDQEQDDAILAPAITALALFAEADIKYFQDLLAEKLFALDKQAYAEQIGEHRYGGPRHFSVDHFLYARACVVANGQAFYEQVLKEPNKMPKDYTFEALLYLAGQAYESKTGEAWDYLPELSYETYTNRGGWGGKSWLDTL